MDAVASPGNNLVLSFIERVSMKMHRRLSIPDDTSVFRTVGDVGASRWIGPAFWALIANRCRSEQMTVYIHYARGRDSLSVISLRHMKQPSRRVHGHPDA